MDISMPFCVFTSITSTMRRLPEGVKRGSATDTSYRETNGYRRYCLQDKKDGSFWVFFFDTVVKASKLFKLIKNKLVFRYIDIHCFEFKRPANASDMLCLVCKNVYAAMKEHRLKTYQQRPWHHSHWNQGLAFCKSERIPCQYFAIFSSGV